MITPPPLDSRMEAVMYLLNTSRVMKKREIIQLEENNRRAKELMIDAGWEWACCGL